MNLRLFRSEMSRLALDMTKTGKIFAAEQYHRRRIAFEG
jgi:hypothetical protein